MGNEVIRIDGFEVPLEQTPFGPQLAVSPDPDLELLRPIVNSALEGELPGFADSVTRGEPRSDGTSFARPVETDDDLTAAREAWYERTGDMLGDDAYAVGVRWRGKNFILPREVLAGLVRRVEAMRADTRKPP